MSSKSNSSVDYAMLEYCIREDLKMKRPRMMAVLHPLKLVIDNYPEGQIEYLDVPNNQENPKRWVQEKYRSAENFISNRMISWKYRLRSISVSIPATKFV